MVFPASCLLPERPRARARQASAHEPRPRDHRQLLVQRAAPGRIGRVVALAAPGLELRVRAAARPRARRSVHGRGRRPGRRCARSTSRTRTSCAPCSAGRNGRSSSSTSLPRFALYDRFFKPSMIASCGRLGEPRAPRELPPHLRVRPHEVASWRASNHIEYSGFPAPVRLTTTSRSVRRGRAPVPARRRPPPRPHLGRAGWRRASRRRPSGSSSARSTTGAAG